MAQKTEHVLSLQDKEYFKEQNTFFPGGPVPGFIQLVHYDKPQSGDTEPPRQLKVLLLDTVALKKEKVFDVEKDTAIIRCYFDILSVWDWYGEEDNTIAGTIRILSWTPTTMQVKLDLRVTRKRNEYYLYNGTRTFEVMEEK